MTKNSHVVELIKAKFAQTGALAEIPLLKGDCFKAKLTDDGSRAIPPWSLTETHERFSDRYWPKQTVKSMEAQESSN